MQACIYSPIFPIASSPHSHRRGWAELWSHHLDVPIFQKGQSLNRFDRVYVYHGHEVGPNPKALNYFLKSDDSYIELADRINRFIEYPGDMVSLDWSCPDYATLVEQRSVKAIEHFEHVNFDAGRERCNTMRTETMLFDAGNMIIGDSHAASVWQPGASISRNDFKTLHGALEQGLASFVHGSPTKITWYFGNIDIRHHLCRMSDPIQAARELATEYVEQARELSMFSEFVHPLPIEPETRKIPKTGYYKNQPFHGSWQQRNDVREAFIERIRELINYPGSACYEYSWPSSWLDTTGALSEDHMERPRSVHLSPVSYRWKNNA